VMDFFLDLPIVEVFNEVFCGGFFLGIVVHHFSHSESMHMIHVSTKSHTLTAKV
jgi:hypothetical protein